ncbi:hypothetical protein [Agrococcus sediminis]|uniref:hypothetical protein n=1 Tax=Agrococcus sediminis TaxID=2599924 RepID=UPI003447F8F7
MAIEYRISAVKPKVGDTITFPTPGVTCIVGGNNAGKSQLLRELQGLAAEFDGSSRFVVN